MQLYILPFIVEAFGSNPKIYKDIDRLYQKRKYEYYKAAKEDELYNHQIITEGSLVQEEYCKKALGLILLSEKYADLKEGLSDVIRKGWTYAYLYVSNNPKIFGEKFLINVVKKSGGLDNVSDDYINGQILILYFLANGHEKEIVYDDFYKRFMGNLSLRWNHYRDNDPSRLSIKNVDKETLNKVRNLKNQIFSENGSFSNFHSMYTKMREQSETTAFLFDFDKLSCDSVFKDIKFSDRDITEILLVFLVRNETYTLDKATDFLCSGVYIRYLIKAYKEVKKKYFENNRETMYVELEGLEKERDEYAKENKLLKKELAANVSKIEHLERENKKLREEVEREKRSRNELNSLREFLFNLDRQEDYIEENVNLELLKDVKAVVIGGHDKWQARMKEYLPNYIFISPDQLNFDIKTLEKVEIVFIYTNYLSHALYYKVMQALEGSSIKISYVNNQNDQMVLKAMYHEIKTLEG